METKKKATPRPKTPIVHYAGIPCVNDGKPVNNQSYTYNVANVNCPKCLELKGRR